MEKLNKSELIFELASKIKHQKGFKKEERQLKYNISEVNIEVLSEEVSKKICRERGSYISLKFDELLFYNKKAKDYLSKKIGKAFLGLAKKHGCKINKVLIIGLGNEKFACDSLGKLVTDKILITKPYLDKDLFDFGKLAEVYAVSLGVYGTTGLDSSEVVKSVCDFLKPDLVIAIDSLVAEDFKSICHSIQLSNTKLIPGGGVHNNRKEISYSTLGVKTIAIGVPMVVAADNDMIVTPKDIESKAENLSKIISKALNLTLNSISEQELIELTE